MVLPGVCLAGVVAVFAMTSSTQSTWTAAKITNGTDSVASGGLAFTHAGTASCAAGPSVTSTTTCAGSIVPTTAVPATGAATGTDAITNNGTIPSASLTQTVQAASPCAPVQFANTKTISDPMLARYTTTFQQADKWGSTSAVGLGSPAYAADVVVTSPSAFQATAWGIGLWFKVASGYAAGGGLLSLDDSPSNGTSASPAVAMWMDGTGKIRTRVGGSGTNSLALVSAASYNDNTWHFAALGRSSGTITLYTDATTTTGSTPLGSPVATIGYWHAGWVDTTGLASAPPSAALTGSVSGVFVTGAAITSSNVTTLRTAATAAAYSSAVLALGSVLHLWMLGDNGTTTYTGTLPASMATPCAKVDVAFAFTNPALTIASQTLAAFANGTPRTVTAPGPGVTQTMTVSLSRDASYTTDIAGLRLYAPLTIVERTAAGSWALTFTWSGANSVFLA